MHAPLHDHTPSGTWYVVRQGDTALEIADRAGIPVEDFLEANGLRHNEPLEAGRIVFVLKNEPPGTAPRQDSSPEKETGKLNQPQRTAAVLQWPMKNPILTSPFGTRWGKPHEGIDMAAAIGTPVYSAAAGVVLYSGDQVKGYGHMLVLQHEGNLVTVYAHNSALKVRIGERVRVGQEIALAGDSGRSTAPHLHFEVRRGELPQDPIPFLPPLK